MKNPPVSFSDTQTAFEYKSDNDLRRAYWLLRLVNINFLVKAGPPFVRLGFRLHLPLKSIIKSTVFKHFCGGETIAECTQVISSLANYHVKTILDFSGEGKETEQDFEITYKHILSTILVAEKDKRIAFCVFKTTGIARAGLLEKMSSQDTLSNAEKQEFYVVKMRFEEICKSCADKDIPVFIDAEESWIQNCIDDLANEMMEKFNRRKVIVYNTLQMYRTDRLQYLRDNYASSLSKGFLPGIKLVRGAYLEKERKRALSKGYDSPIHLSKDNTDKDFDSALEFCADHFERIALCAGTHNERSTLLLINLMSKKNIPATHPHFFFSQLLGMSDHISFNLSRAGYNVAKYVPFGPVETVLPYLFRRAEENTAIAGQMGRELSLIISERKRRSKQKVS